ncbi:hypothetical protein AMTR_s00008p00119590 [Amborella trichopoda]|uniref:Uncharacterized protein n=1 Tax=Amborella trichopoda TaxID=13333 RepID=W1NHN6_AMBTC|nr:hypothetical protein AMTR_s00008p00119590 [Amborella trichopoda]
MESHERQPGGLHGVNRQGSVKEVQKMKPGATGEVGKPKIIIIDSQDSIHWALKLELAMVVSRIIPDNRHLRIFGSREDADRVARTLLEDVWVTAEWWNSKANTSLIRPSSVWLKIETIPIQAWTKAVFEKIVQVCGKRIEIDWFKTAGPSLGVLRAKVACSPEVDIPESLVLKFNNEVSYSPKTQPRSVIASYPSSSSSVTPSKEKDGLSPSMAQGSLSNSGKKEEEWQTVTKKMKEATIRSKSPAWQKRRWRVLQIQPTAPLRSAPLRSSRRFPSPKVLTFAALRYLLQAVRSICDGGRLNPLHHVEPARPSKSDLTALLPSPPPEKLTPSPSPSKVQPPPSMASQRITVIELPQEEPMEIIHLGLVPNLSKGVGQGLCLRPYCCFYAFDGGQSRLGSPENLVFGLFPAHPPC